MFTRTQLDNVEHNFATYSHVVLNSKTHDIWRPIILRLIKQARCTNEDKGAREPKANQRGG